MRCIGCRVRCRRWCERLRARSKRARCLTDTAQWHGICSNRCVTSTPFTGHSMTTSNWALGALLAISAASTHGTNTAAAPRSGDHRQRRPVQRLPLPRHFADRPQAGAARRLRPEPQLRRLPRQLELEYRQRLLQRQQPRDGSLRRLQDRIRRRRPRCRRDLLLLPGQRQGRYDARSTIPRSTSVRASARSAPNIRTRSPTSSARPTPRAADYFDLGFTHDLGSGLGVNAHLGYQRVRNTPRPVGQDHRLQARRHL